MAKNINTRVESKNGKTVLTFKKTADMQQQMTEALKAAGDNTVYKSIIGEDGKQHIFMEIQPTDDIIDLMRKNGDIFDIRQYHRFVTSHMLSMLTKKDNTGRAIRSARNGYYDLTAYTENMKSLGLMYPWKETTERYNAVLVARSKGDNAGADEDSVFYNAELINRMFLHLEHQLNWVQSNMKTRKCQGKPYFKYRHFGEILNLRLRKGIFKSDFHKVIEAVEDYRLRFLENKNSFHSIVILENFIHIMPNLDKLAKCEFRGGCHLVQCPEWQEAYKGFGAYFTMKNLVMGKYQLKVRINKDVDVALSGKDARNYLKDEILKELKGYQMLGMLKVFLEYNAFDINAVKEEWCKEKMARLNSK